MAIPTFFARGPFLILRIVTCCTVCLIRRFLQVLIGSVTLKAFYVCYAVNRVIPILVHLWGCILVTLGTGRKLLLF